MKTLLSLVIVLILASLAAVACQRTPMVDSLPATQVVDEPEPVLHMRELKDAVAASLDSTNPHKVALHRGTRYRFRGAIKNITSSAVDFHGGDYTLTCDSRTEKALYHYDNVEAVHSTPSARWVNQIIEFEDGDVVVAEGKYYKWYRVVIDNRNYDEFYVLSDCRIIERFVSPARDNNTPQTPRTIDTTINTEDIPTPERKDNPGGVQVIPFTP